LNDKDRVQQFIIKATGKTIGRNTKESLSILFANTYAEYVKSINDINNGYKIYKNMDNKIKTILESIDGKKTISTKIIQDILERKDDEIELC
jgi:uncharacterized UPF0160 family protein